MSISNLLQPNNYDIFMGSIEIPELIIYNIDDDTKKVTQTVNSNNALVVDGGNLYIDGMQFSTDGNQNIINYYSVLSSAEANALFVTTPLGNTINLTPSSIKVTRIGNVVTINLPNSLTEDFFTGPNYGNTDVPFIMSPLPSRFRPSVDVSCTYAYVNTHDPLALGSVQISSGGGIVWAPTFAATGLPGRWDTTLESSSVDIYRTCFSYII